MSTRLHPHPHQMAASCTQVLTNEEYIARQDASIRRHKANSVFWKTVTLHLVLIILLSSIIASSAFYRSSINQVSSFVKDRADSFLSDNATKVDDENEPRTIVSGDRHLIPDDRVNHLNRKMVQREFVIKTPSQSNLIFNAPWARDRNPKLSVHFGKRHESRKDLLIAARRPEMFFELPGIYSDYATKLTIAHFGWTLQSPFAALNFHQLHHDILFKNGALSVTDKDRNKVLKDLKIYVEEYLMGPWKKDSPLCSKNAPSMFGAELCAYAVGRFRKQYDALVKDKDGALTRWIDSVKYETFDESKKKKVKAIIEKKKKEAAERWGECRKKARSEQCMEERKIKFPEVYRDEMMNGARRSEFALEY